MYKAKDAGRNAWRCYDEEMNSSVDQNLRLAADMRAGIENKQFVLHYQPQVELAALGSPLKCQFAGNIPNLVQSAHNLILIAEKTGLITEIGSWVPYEACAQMMRLAPSKLRVDVLAEYFGGAISSWRCRTRRGVCVGVFWIACQSAGTGAYRITVHRRVSGLVRRTAAPARTRSQPVH